MIVSPQAGTTRDVVEVSLNLGGYQVHVSDTAGLRSDSSDPIEIQGITRATQRYREPFYSLSCHNVRQPPPFPPQNNNGRLKAAGD